HWHRYEHPLPEMPDRGHKDRPPRQPAIKLRLRHMLVFEAKRVKLEGGAALVVMRFDHLPAAAGIAADRVDRDGVIARQDAGVDERPDQRNRAGRVAAGVGDLARGSDALGLAL